MKRVKVSASIPRKKKKREKEEWEEKGHNARRGLGAGEQKNRSMLLRHSNRRRKASEIP